MKKIFLLLSLCAFWIHLNATSTFEQLCMFNFNWENYPMQVNANECAVSVSEQEYVQLHLSHVIPILKSNSINDLSAEQLHVRNALIAVLQSYCKAGQFPLNDYVNYRVPVFIDRYNTYCAVGYLMRASGFNELAVAISRDNNLAWVKDIRVDGVEAWQQLSGFTMDELKLIQGAYDYYHPDAFLLPNKYEVPQKPEVVVRYFEDEQGRQPKDLFTAVLWCKGEGANGELHGKWTQNYSTEFPWIEGYFSHGKRTGQWKEYYPGTSLLCRTENWRNDKLNGVRKRFDRNGKIIEEILFRDGMAATKTNYNFIDSVYHVRKPIDSAHVSTEVFTLGGKLLAAGTERVHNPGNLLWFQNIELTALNSAAITSRELSFQPSFSISNDRDFLTGRRMPFYGQSPLTLFGTPPLVEYFKEGVWKYYNEENPAFLSNENRQFTATIRTDYREFVATWNGPSTYIDEMNIRSTIDSIHVLYSNNSMNEFIAFGSDDYIRIRLMYHPSTTVINGTGLRLFADAHLAAPSICSVSRYNNEFQRVGNWKYFDQNGQLLKVESYVVPQEEKVPVDSESSLPLGDAWRR
ncbi:MAG: toxin-antitoxin system YwqK family antitoxin [Flavobacteriales bacterium]